MTVEQSTEPRPRGKLLELREVGKAFGGFHAVRSVSLGVRSGETYGILGDNGAGKSTVIKMLAGVHAPDRGELVFEGAPVRLASPAHARRLGIETVFQDLALVDELSVARNFFLGAELKRGMRPLRLLDETRMRERTSHYLGDIGITRLRSPDDPVMFLSGGERQAIAIARAMYFGAKLIVLDEPTSALGLREARKVMDYVRVANERGIAVVLISHNLRHVLPVAQRVGVMHQGELIAEFGRDAFDETVIEALITEGPEALQTAGGAKGGDR